MTWNLVEFAPSYLHKWEKCRLIAKPARIERFFLVRVKDGLGREEARRGQGKKSRYTVWEERGVKF